MRTARLLAALAISAAALTLTACGGSSPSSGTSPAAPSVAQVAAQIGATGVSVFSPTLYASHEGSATWHGQQIDIATFATDQLRDQWEAIARQSGPILADGHDYAVTAG